MQTFIATAYVHFYYPMNSIAILLCTFSDRVPIVLYNLNFLSSILYTFYFFYTHTYIYIILYIYIYIYIYILYI